MHEICVCSPDVTIQLMKAVRALGAEGPLFVFVQQGGMMGSHNGQPRYLVRRWTRYNNYRLNTLYVY